MAQSDSEGGANKAAFRLHRALQRQAITSTFHAGRVLRADAQAPAARAAWLGLEGSRIAAFLNAAPLRLYAQRTREPFSPSILSYGRIDPALLSRADVVCLHWVAGAFLRPAQLRSIGRPIVWRLSDLWPFTGGCHYPGACRGFEQACGACPSLGSRHDKDLSRIGFRQRERAYPDLDLTVVAPSRWIGEEARRSSLFAGCRIEHIPTGIDLSVFRRCDKAKARAHFGLPQDARIILFGALGALSDARKGFPAFGETMERLRTFEPEANVAVALFGGGAAEAPESIGGFPVHNVGRLDSEEELARLYSAADLLVAPFLEDNLPNVVLEALGCGLPVAAFAAGGIPDAVVPGESGALAPTGDTQALAGEIAGLLARPGSLADLGEGARRMAEERFDLEVCAKNYAALFRELAGDRRAPSA
nr:glycosyltransferase [Afifella sp. IM 167]